MTWKTALAVFGGVLGIICGEALKLGYTDWTQLGALQYWLGIGVQIASLIGVYCGGLYQSVPSNETKVDLTKIGSLVLLLALLAPLTGCAAKTALQTREHVILSLDGVTTAVRALQDAEHTLYTSGVVTALTSEKHQAINAKLVAIWTLEDAALVAVRAWNPTDPVPTQVVAFLGQVTALLQDTAILLGTALPEKLTQVWTAVTKLLALFGGGAL